MEMISRELGAGLPLELLYADDLILMAESEESVRNKIVKWKGTTKRRMAPHSHAWRRIAPHSRALPRMAPALPHMATDGTALPP